MDMIGWLIVILSVGAGIVKLTGKYNGYAERFSPMGGIATVCGVLACILMVLLFNSICYDESAVLVVLEIAGILLFSCAPFFIAKQEIGCEETPVPKGFIAYRIACGIGILFLAIGIFEILMGWKNGKKRR